MLENHLEKLKGFREVAKQGSILRAANVLGLSQPSLTKSIQTLEEAIGDRLFVRHSRGIQLTEAGTILLNYSDKLFLEIEDIKIRLHSRQQMSGILRVGSFETLGVSFWPKALLRLKKEYPELHVHITTENTSSIWQRLEQGTLDLIVDAEPPLLERYFSKVLYTDQFGLFVNPKYQISEGPLTLSYVQRAYDRDGKSIRTHLLNQSIGHELAYDFDSFVAVRAVAIANLAVAVLPLSLAEPDVRNRKLIPLKRNGRALVFGPHRICATCLEDRRKDKKITAIMKVLKANFSEGGVPAGTSATT